MIKLVIFDLDGVITDSKDLHFEALNNSLVEHKYDPISYKDHISKFDGLPTSEKLSMLGIDSVSAKKIGSLKQKLTLEMLQERTVPCNKLIDIFSSLKGEGYKVHVASNSIRNTIVMILDLMDLSSYVDYIVSNEEVIKGKPAAEMYLRCMLEAGVGPRESIIIEDSYVGRKGAFNAGAHLCAVNNPEEVTKDLIKSSILRANGSKQKWKGNKMNVLIPMAGAGSRFAKAGYTFPKPLIEVSGKPMIQVVIENLGIEATYTYVVQREHFDEYNLGSMLNMITPDCNIVFTEGVTEGAACTTLLAKEHIDNDDQLLIANSDQWVDWDSSDFMYSVQGEHVDGGILHFKASHPKWSYIKVDENNYVTELAEKKVISDLATVGIYHWKRGSDYVKYAEQMIDKDIRVNGEFYVAPVYNEAIEDGLKIKPYEVSGMYGLGTPEDLNYFNSKNILS
jgi:HAD superfamily hydrolase (TIGR01509 family)